MIKYVHTCVHIFIFIHSYTYKCKLTIFYIGGATYTIAFTKFPLTPYENNYFTNNGNPPITDFLCENVNANGFRRVRVDCILSLATPVCTCSDIYLSSYLCIHVICINVCIFIHMYVYIYKCTYVWDS
jgi:hypothetical protein